MSDLSKSLLVCSAGRCNEECSLYNYGAGCRGVLLCRAAIALDEWEKLSPFLAAHGLLPEDGAKYTKLKFKPDFTNHTGDDYPN